ncbi:MAG: Na+/H+ antiporter NhaA [Phycicoccus sp.]
MPTTPTSPVPIPPPPRSRGALLRRPSWVEAQAVTDALRTETIGGTLLLVAALAALVLANSPASDAYTGLRDTYVGVEWGELRLTLGHWAADGLLAVFFFVAGLELKREFLVGDLRSREQAVVPVVAAVGGVVVPALLFVAVVSAMDAGPEALRGWAIPTATDIAFALAVLAVIGSSLPAALRSFLLTLAVVDDLIAITIIAVFYTTDLDAAPLLLAVLPLAGFAALTQRRITHWWLLVPLALATWALVHASGVHATVAGVLLGLAVPVRPRRSVPSISTLDRSTDVAHRFEHRMRPLSAGLAVPVFAFFAAGVNIVGGGLSAAAADPVAVGVVVALVVGKLVGIFGATWLLARFTRARLADDLGWADIFGLALLCGVGFTVSLLIGDLAFGDGSERAEHVKIAVLLGSLVAATLAAVVLRLRNAVHRRICAEEMRDDDADGVPDVYQREDHRDGSAPTG